MQETQKCINRRVAEWNQKYPIGTVVQCSSPFGPTIHRTASEAYLKHTMAMIQLEGLKHPIRFSRIKLRDPVG